jgi:hypothetical protein
MQENSDLDEIIEFTSLVSLVEQILSFDHQQDDFIYFMKNEALWILINLCYGSEENIRKIFQLD